MLDRGVFLIALGTTGVCLDLMGISGYMLVIATATLLTGVVTLSYSIKNKLDVRETDKPAAA